MRSNILWSMFVKEKVGTITEHNTHDGSGMIAILRYADISRTGAGDFILIRY